MSHLSPALFRRWLKQRRKEYGYTQEELAQMVGCSPITVSRIEEGVLRPSRQLAGLVVAALEAPPDEREDLVRRARADPLKSEPAPAPAEDSQEATATPSDQAATPEPGKWLPASLTGWLTRFIGRAREIAEVQELLAASRLLTLTGTGGCGKTRLALEVLRKTETSAFPDGMWVIDLSPLTDQSVLPQVVVTTLGIREHLGREPIFTLCDHLRSRTVLLLLDNCEHMLDACALLADTVLRTCPGVRIIATSRQPINIEGEMTWRVPSLTTPEIDYTPLPKELERYEAVQLFVDRARLRVPDFQLDGTSARAVGELCYHLDGLPLAIELAAARMDVLSVEQIVSRLGERFRLLTGGSRGSIPRHRTLRAALDWSYALLSEDEQRMLRRLSVIAGSFSLEAARAIWDPQADELDTLDLLERLVDKSLVNAGEHGEPGTMRYRLLETVRQYGQEKLAESGEAEEISSRHYAFFTALVGDILPGTYKADQASWMARLDVEQDNYRAALRWAIAAEPERALHLVGLLIHYWYLRGWYVEGSEWAAQALAGVGYSLGEYPGDMPFAAGQWPLPDCAQNAPAHDLAKVLLGAAMLAMYQGNNVQARIPAEQSAAIARNAGDTIVLAQALNAVGIILDNQGDPRSALPVEEESLRLYRELGEESRTTYALTCIGTSYAELGELNKARAYFDEALVIQRRLGDVHIVAAALSNIGLIDILLEDYQAAREVLGEAMALGRATGEDYVLGNVLANLAVAAARQDNPEEAEGFCTESLRIRQEIGDRLGLAECFEIEAWVESPAIRGQEAATRESLEHCAALWGAAEAVRKDMQIQLPSDQAGYHEEAVASVRALLGEEALAQAWLQGTLAQVEQRQRELVAI